MTNGLKQSFCAACPQMHITASKNPKIKFSAAGSKAEPSSRWRECPWIQKIANNYLVKCVEKKFLMQMERLQDFDLLRGVVGRHHSAPLTTFKNLASPKLAIVKGDFPVSEQQEEEKRTFSKLRCRLCSCLSSHQALMPLQLFIKQIALLSLLFVGRSTTWCPSSCLSNQVLTRLSTFTVCIAIAALNLIYASACSWQRRPFWQMQCKNGQSHKHQL